jgi:LDH2 family malate/lactate/ureidoglycolate dehydrogenase
MYKDMDREQNVGHFFCLLDIAAFMEPAQFRSRIDSMIDQIKSSRKRPGVDEILVPGERSYRTRQRNLQRGVSVDPQTLDELRILSNEHDVPFVLERRRS